MLIIKKLTPELTDDYLHFFDTTPHSERADDDDCKCYCVWWCSDDHNNKVFEDFLSTREKRRDYAKRNIKANNIQGYLAYYDNKVVAWCNANTKSDCYNCFCWRNFMGSVHKDESTSPNIKIKSVLCFAVAPQMRGKGVATLLLKRICEDAKADGFDFIEAYPNKNFINEAEDYMGPSKLYIKEGFAVCYETDKKLVMRKKLY